MPAFLPKALRALAVAAILVVPAAAKAQGDVVYSPSELDNPPKLVSQEMTARLLAKSYPAALQKAGVTGDVQIQFVVDETGKVDESSIKVLTSTVPALADAAKGIVGQIKFRPGQLQGKPVKSVVLLPIAYK